MMLKGRREELKREKMHLIAGNTGLSEGLTQLNGVANAAFTALTVRMPHH